MVDDEFEIALLDWGRALELVVISQVMIPELGRIRETERVVAVTGIVTAVAAPLKQREIGVATTTEITVRVRTSDVPTRGLGEVLCLAWQGQRYEVASSQVGERVTVLRGRGIGLRV